MLEASCDNVWSIPKLDEFACAIKPVSSILPHDLSSPTMLTRTQIYRHIHPQTLCCLNACTHLYGNGEREL